MMLSLPWLPATPAHILSESKVFTPHFITGDLAVSEGVGAGQAWKTLHLTHTPAVAEGRSLRSLGLGLLLIRFAFSI